MIFVGIDPGITGAIAILSEDGHELVAAHRTPVIQAASGGKREYNSRLMADLLIDLENDFGNLVVTIEKVHTMPRDGRVGAFNFGMGYGIWLGILAARHIAHTLVTPQAWQARMLAGLPRGPHTKASAVKTATAMWPHLPIKAKADWGLADAALIAEYGRRAGVPAK